MAAVLGMMLGVCAAHADEPITMAPPIPVSSVPGDTPGNASQDTVFSWKEVPAHQRVTIIRAVFDQGGYQLFDNVGETIVVPFTHRNLYVMKFAQSHTRDMYFVNDGDAPVLYIPHNGYLENATVPSGKWYPFPRDARADLPAQPVYLGIAPSWLDYEDMGWYPDMDYYGGYYCREPFEPGVDLVPTYGLSITIGDQPYYGWSDYHRYYEDHPAPFHEEIVNPHVYHWANSPDQGQRQFVGGGTGFAARNFSGDPNFGAGRFGDQNSADRSFNGGGRVFQGGHSAPARPSFSGPTQTFNNGPQFSPPQVFTNIPRPSPHVRTFNGGDSPPASRPNFGGGGGNVSSIPSFGGGGNFGGGGGGGFGGGGGNQSSGGGGGHASGGGGFVSGGHRR